jgi:hypothetical protein
MMRSLRDDHFLTDCWKGVCRFLSVLLNVDSGVWWDMADLSSGISVGLLA